MTADLRSEARGATHLVALARPQKRNALTDDLCAALAAELQRIADAGTARVILLTGDGGHFCVGGDLGWLLQTREHPDPTRFRQGLAAFQDLIRTIVALPVPVVALIPGSAAGFGLDLALACDYRIAANDAQLTSAFAKMGLVPDGGSSVTLRTLLPAGRAFRFLVAGEVVAAADALRLGLVDEVVPATDLLTAGEGFAAQVAQQPASAVGAIKTLLRRTDLEALERGLEAEGHAQLAALAGADFQQRAAAFLARKRG